MGASSSKVTKNIDNHSLNYLKSKVNNFNETLNNF